MATELGLSARECRQALQAYVEMDLMSYRGLDRHGIESWSLSKAGFVVWQYSRVNGRATKDRVRQFEQSLPHVVSALSKYPLVTSIRVGGASVLERPYGLFLIGIEVDPADTSPMAELRLIDMTTQLLGGPDVENRNFHPDMPCVLVFDSIVGTPQRIRTGKTLFDRASNFRAQSVNESPAYASDKVDAQEAQWHARLRSYEDLFRADEQHGFASISLADFVFDRKERTSPPKETQAYRDLKSALSMIYYERERISSPAYCIQSDQQWPDNGLNSPAPDLELLKACQDMFDAEASSNGFRCAPHGWPIAAANADYAFSCGRPEILTSKVLSECLDHVWHDHHTIWMRKGPPAKVLQALAIGANEFRAKVKAQTEQVPLKKQAQTVSSFISLFDFARPKPTCIGVVRLTSRSDANFKAAVRHYSNHIGQHTSGVRVLFKCGYLTAEPFITHRPSTPDEICKFERVAQISKKAVGYVVEERGETVLGHKGYATSMSSMDLNFRASPLLQLRPIDVSSYREDILMDALSKMPADLAKRLSHWWVFPGSTPVQTVAKACIEGPETSLLARFADPSTDFEFAAMTSHKGCYSARISGDDWYLALTGLGAKEPPMAEYHYQGNTSRVQLKCRYAWRGMLDEIKGVMSLLSILKRVGVAQALAQIDPQEFPSSGGALSGFESLLNAIFTGWIFSDQHPYEHSPFEPCFGAGVGDG
ncbi:hypothetical protein [Rhodoferax ferrireducens]|nr:hypothetical protein [Rhodoferax ferrireducens]